MVGIARSGAFPQICFKCFLFYFLAFLFAHGNILTEIVDMFGPDMNRNEMSRYSSKTILIRLFWRPFFSILDTRTLPISPVRLTWVPPQG